MNMKIKDMPSDARKLLLAIVDGHARRHFIARRFKVECLHHRSPSLDNTDDTCATVFGKALAKPGS